MNTTKLTLKLLLVISLFCATAFADESYDLRGGFADDGHMSGGGFAEGDMPNGVMIENQPEANPILRFVRGYLFSIFG